MNEIFTYALVELFFSLILGITLLYFTYKSLHKFFFKKYNIKDYNMSFSIVISSILLSVAYLISDIKSPILNSIKMVSSQADYQGSIIFDGFKYTFLFLFIIVLAISIIIFISIWLFTLMTKNIDEFNEIKKDNKAIGLLLAVIIFSVSLMVKESLYFLIETFVPYPEVINIF
tara:strand:+ start:484 stop:1002 length:519 start_codon:yes stop_codon:yes gene_type:complete